MSETFKNKLSKQNLLERLQFCISAMDALVDVLAVSGYGWSIDECINQQDVDRFRRAKYEISFLYPNIRSQLEILLNLTLSFDELENKSKKED